jgi:hypothetical protein
VDGVRFDEPEESVSVVVVKVSEVSLLHRPGAVRRSAGGVKIGINVVVSAWTGFEQQNRSLSAASNKPPGIGLIRDSCDLSRNLKAWPELGPELWRETPSAKG